MPLLHTQANKPQFLSRLWAATERGAYVWRQKKVLVGFSTAGRALACFRAALIVAADQQGGNGMLEDELFLGFGFKHDGILVKRTHVS
jgi:hypothetical protein